MLCPRCNEWAPVEAWRGDPPPPNVPFKRICPHCGAKADVSDLDYRISPGDLERH